MQQPDITGVTEQKRKKRGIATLAQMQSQGVAAYVQVARFLLCTGQCFHTNINGGKGKLFKHSDRAKAWFHHV